MYALQLGRILGEKESFNDKLKKECVLYCVHDLFVC